MKFEDLDESLQKWLSETEGFVPRVERMFTEIQCQPERVFDWLQEAYLEGYCEGRERRG